MPPSATAAPVRRPAPRGRRTNAAEQVALIRATPAAEAGELAFLPSGLIQAMLPHREVYESGPGGRANRKKALVYTRENGRFALSIRPGVDARGHSLGVPYGGLGRLLLVHICTEAVRRRSREVDLGRTLGAFLDRLDIAATGGRHGRIPYVWDQLQRLATCAITTLWTERTEEGRVVREESVFDNAFIVEHARFWRRGGVGADEDRGGRVVLSEKFYRGLMERKLPADFRKLQHLRAHPLALDLYLLCTYLAHLMQQRGERERAISWEALRVQLGGHYDRQDDFAYRARQALRKVQLVWPELDYATPRGRFVLRTAVPDIAAAPPTS